jgi:hypothetical protein
VSDKFFHVHAQVLRACRVARVKFGLVLLNRRVTQRMILCVTLRKTLRNSAVLQMRKITKI